MTVSITAFYAAPLALLMIVLSGRISLARKQSDISLGCGDDKVLTERVRAFGNFAEWVPMALLLMALAELSGAAAVTLHVIGALLLGGRMLHPLGLDADRTLTLPRFLGTAMTYGAILVAVARLARAALSA